MVVKERVTLVGIYSLQFIVIVGYCEVNIILERNEYLCKVMNNSAKSISKRKIHFYNDISSTFDEGPNQLIG